MLVCLACDLLVHVMYLAPLWPPLGLRGGLSLPRRAQLLRRFGRWFCAIDARVLAVGLGCWRVTGAAAAAEPFGARAATEREAAATAVGLPESCSSHDEHEAQCRDRDGHRQPPAGRVLGAAHECRQNAAGTVAAVRLYEVREDLQERTLAPCYTMSHQDRLRTACSLQNSCAPPERVALKQPPAKAVVEISSDGSLRFAT